MSDTPVASGGPLVLVADDEAPVRNLVSEVLRRAGFRTLAVSDGDEAFRLACEERPALVLLDVMMPKMDGYTTLTRLRGHPMTTDVPVIILTGRTEALLQDLSNGVGAAAHLTKPFLPGDLLQTVRRALGGPVS